MSDNEILVSSFRQTSPYINAYRKKTFVIMFPGAAISNPNFGNMIQDIALLQSLGIRLVLVHGAREQIDKRLQADGFDSLFHRQLRITQKEHLNCLLQAVGSTRFIVEAALSRGLPNSAMYNANISVNSGNLVTGMPLGIVEGVDYQYTGKVRSIAKQALNSILDRDGIVLISPIGFSSTGEMFNLAYTDIATQIAIQIQADKLISFDKNNGIVDPNNNLYRQLTLSQCKQLLSSEVFGEHYESFHACYTACNQGVVRAQLISYADDGALIKELFSRDGVGTMIHRDSYEVIRRGHINDVGGIIELITPLEEKGVLVRRPRELLEQEIENFTVVEKDGMVVACAALYPFSQGAAGELACVATDPAYQGDGRASKLLQHIENQAKKLAIKQLFVLTTQASHWFIERGFTSTEPDHLPTEKQRLYNYRRNSRVLIKSISHGPNQQ